MWVRPLAYVSRNSSKICWCEFGYLAYFSTYLTCVVCSFWVVVVTLMWVRPLAYLSRNSLKDLLMWVRLFAYFSSVCAYLSLYRNHPLNLRFRSNSGCCYYQVSSAIGLLLTFLRFFFSTSSGLSSLRLTQGSHFTTGSKIYCTIWISHEVFVPPVLVDCSLQPLLSIGFGLVLDRFSVDDRHRLSWGMRVCLPGFQPLSGLWSSSLSRCVKRACWHG
jgi:hypothetical protein